MPRGYQNAMLSSVCQANRGVCLDGMGPVHREKHQICGERAATGSRFVKSNYRRRSSVTTMLESLNWVSLASRRAEAKLVMLYRIANNLVDVSTSALTAAPTRTRGNTHRYLQPFTRIEAYKHSFFPSTIKSWNKCTQQLVSKQSLNSFRRLLQSMST